MYFVCIGTLAGIRSKYRPHHTPVAPPTIKPFNSRNKKFAASTKWPAANVLFGVGTLNDQPHNRDYHDGQSDSFAFRLGVDLKLLVTVCWAWHHQVRDDLVEE